MGGSHASSNIVPRDEEAVKQLKALGFVCDVKTIPFATATLPKGWSKRELATHAADQFDYVYADATGAPKVRVFGKQTSYDSYCHWTMITSTTDLPATATMTPEELAKRAAEEEKRIEEAHRRKLQRIAEENEKQRVEQIIWNRVADMYEASCKRLSAVLNSIKLTGDEHKKLAAIEEKREILAVDYEKPASSSEDDENVRSQMYHIIAEQDRLSKAIEARHSLEEKLLKFPDLRERKTVRVRGLVVPLNDYAIFYDRRMPEVVFGGPPADRDEMKKFWKQVSETKQPVEITAICSSDIYGSRAKILEIHRKESKEGKISEKEVKQVIPIKLELLSWPHPSTFKWSYVDLVGQVLPLGDEVMFADDLTAEVEFQDGSSSKDDFWESLGKPHTMSNLWRHEHHLLPTVVNIRCYEPGPDGKRQARIRHICRTAALPYTPAFDRGYLVPSDKWTGAKLMSEDDVPAIVAKHSAWFDRERDEKSLLAALLDIIHLRNLEVEKPTIINAVVPLIWHIKEIRPAAVHAFRLCLYDLGFRGCNRLYVWTEETGRRVVGWHIKLYDINVINATWHKDAINHDTIQTESRGRDWPYEKPIKSKL